MNALAVLENQLKPLAPRLEMVLDKRVPVDRLMQTIMISCERLPKLLECDRQSLFNSAMSAAVLGLEVDGVTGQAYLIPFKGRAQLVVGYKGYNTLAARSGITITGKVVREGDDFDFDVGEGWVRHKPAGSRGRITHAWAKAAAAGRPAVVEVMMIDELLEIKKRSPGASRSDSPWNDPAIGFPAMCEKSVKRRLARSMPLNVMQVAARMDEAVDEQGVPAWVDPRVGVVLDGRAEPSPTPSADYLIGSATPPTGTTAADPGASSPQPQQRDEAPDVTATVERLKTEIGKLGSADACKRWAGANKATIAALPEPHKSNVSDVYYTRKESFEGATQ